MSDLALNTNHDIDVKNNDLYLTKNSDWVRQRLEQTMDLFYGEWFLDTTVGIPYYQRILVKNPNLDEVQATLLSAIQNSEGVIQVLDFSFDYDNSRRTLSVSFDARISNGEVVTVQRNIGG